ncbi:hypothetical protein ACFLUC_04040, partial [Chloroflexota bacterium]
MQSLLEMRWQVHPTLHEIKKQIYPGYRGKQMAHRTLLITYIATYLIAIGAIVRYLVRFKDDRLWIITFLLAVYLVLLFLEPILSRRNRYLTYLYLFSQTAIISSISFITPNVDFWAVLFFPLVLQAMHNFSQRTGFLLTGIFTVIMTILMLIGVGPEMGIPLILINGVVYFFLAAFIAITREAEISNERLARQ